MVEDLDFRLLMAANAIGALGTALVSPLLDTLTGPFGVSAAQIGLMVTAVAAPAVVLIPLSGVLVDRIGRKPVLVAGLALFGIGGVAIAFTTNFSVVLGLRIVQGIGFSGVTPVIITILGDLYDGDSEATAQGLRFGVSGLSQAVFPALAGALIVVAWQYPFVIYGFAIPVAIAVAIWFEEPTAGERPGSPEDTPAASDDGGPDATGYARRLAGLAAHRRVAAFLLARAIIVMPFIGFLTYNSLVVVRVLDGSPRTAGIVVAVFSLVYAAMATQTGRVTAAFASLTVPLVTANVFLAAGLAGFALAPSLPIAIVSVCILAIGVGLTYSLYRSIITGLAPAHLRGGLVGLSESAGRLVATFTPIVIGVGIAVGEPVLGATGAIQLAVVVAGLGAGSIGVASVLVAQSAELTAAELA